MSENAYHGKNEVFRSSCSSSLFGIASVIYPYIVKNGERLITQGEVELNRENRVFRCL